MPLDTGFVLNNRYRIVRLLGQGGFGAVYRAWDISLRRPCALKENLNASTSAQLQFEREARILADLSHPNLPQIYDHFILPGQGQYLVMEYIEGEDLDSKIANPGAQPDQAACLDWVLQICAALEYLHSQNPPVIHRDVKPANIRITPQGKALLVDFGIAKTYDPGVKTVTGARSATPGYAPPEQYGIGITDGRSDLYALGATLYHLLTGVIPPPAMEIVAGNCPPPATVRQVNPSIPIGISQPVEKAMQLNRAARYTGVMDFAAALRAGSIPAPAPQPGPSYQALPTTPAQPPARRQPRAWFGVGLTFFIVAAVMALFYFRVLPNPFSAEPPPTQIAGQESGEPGSPATVTQTFTKSPSPLPRTTISPTPSLLPTLTATIQPSQTPSPPTDTPTALPPPVPVAKIPIRLDNAAQVAEIARLGKGVINQVALSPDGKTLGVASSYGVYLYDPETFEEKLFIEYPTWVSSLAFSPDGGLLAIGLRDNTVRLVQVGNGQQVRALKGHTSWVNSVAFSPDGQSLASGASDNTVRIWKTSDGSLIRTMTRHTAAVTGVLFSPDGQTLASSSLDNTVRLWGAADGNPRRTLNTGRWYGDPIPHQIAFSSDSQSIAVSIRNLITLWKVSTGSQYSSLDSQGLISSIAYLPGGSTLAVGSGNYPNYYDWRGGYIQLWNTDNASLIMTIQGLEHAVASLAFSRDGQTLVAGDESGAIHFWSGRDLATSKVMEAHSARVGNVLFSPDSSRLAYSAINTYFVNQMPGGHRLHQQQLETQDSWSNESGIADLFFSPDSQNLATVFEGNLRVWDPSGKVTREKWAVNVGDCAAFSPDWQYLAINRSGYYATPIELSQAPDWKTLLTLSGHKGGVTSLAFSPDGQMLASGSLDNSVRLWQVSDGKFLRALIGHNGDITSVLFSPDGKLVASTATDNTIRLWRVYDGQVQQVIKIEAKAGLAFSPDGGLLATASEDGNVRILRVSDGSLVTELKGHTAAVTSVAFSADGLYLASGSEDGTLRVWAVQP